jgi:hypothetical protein
MWGSTREMSETCACSVSGITPRGEGRLFESIARSSKRCWSDGLSSPGGHPVIGPPTSAHIPKSQVISTGLQRSAPST